MLTRTGLIIQFMFCLLQCINNMLWIIDRYDTLWRIIIQYMFNWIKFTGVTSNCIGISSNLCDSVDSMIGNDDCVFCQIFSSTIETTSSVNVSIDCHLNIVLLRIIIGMYVNLSLLSVFSAVYVITSMIDSTPSITARETIVEFFFQLGFICSKIKTKDNNNSDNKQLIMIQYSLFWQLNNSLKPFNFEVIPIVSSSSSTQKKLIDTSRINDNNRICIFFSNIAVHQNAFLFISLILAVVCDCLFELDSLPIVI